MNPLLDFMKVHHKWVAIIFISVMYLVGIVNVALLGNTEILHLTPMQLLLSTALVMAYQQRQKIVWILSLIIFILGLGVEIVGVNTGFPFGTYEYGSVLGWQIMDTPLMIGINWLLVILCTTHLADFLVQHTMLRASVSATIALGLDYLIEPVAIKTGMWTWESDTIPASNFIAWWVIAWVLSYLYQSQVRQNPKAVILVIFAWMVLFFTILNLIV